MTDVPIVGESRGIRLAIALPSHEMIPVTFAQDLAGLIMFTMSAMPEGTDLGVTLVEGTYVHRARQQLIEGLMEAGVTHILWLDTDMRFPQESLAILFRHNVDMVGINYAKRQIPTDYVALKEIYTDGRVSKRLVTDENSTGLEDVDAIGFGMVLMKTSALRRLPSPKGAPWFFFEILPGGQHVGEDVYFCRLFKKHGGRILVDHDLSKLCAHTGMWEYKLDHVFPAE